MREAEEVRRALVSEWLERANEDLGVARHLVEEGTPFSSSVAFQARQAVDLAERVRAAVRDRLRTSGTD